VGLQGMIDPPRDEVRDAIDRCGNAGVRSVMITGDYALTAQAIAHQLGIEGDAVNGEALEKMNDEALTETVKRISIFSRVNPEHKIRIVRALRETGEVVAMSGDGINDAPALKEADIGIAMGIAGTDVTKETADMVLLDDRFTSIVKAVEQGRGIYENIKKFVNYLLSSNLGEVLILFLAMMIGFRDASGTIVMLELVRVTMIRSRYRLAFFSNGYLIGAIAVSVLLQVAVVYIPVMNIVFKTSALTPHHWVYIFAVMVVTFIIGTIIAKLFKQ